MMRTPPDVRPGTFVDAATCLLGLTERDLFSRLGPRRPEPVVQVTPDTTAVVDLAAWRRDRSRTPGRGRQRAAAR